VTGASGDVWEVLATARSIRRFTDEPVDDETLRRCLEVIEPVYGMTRPADHDTGRRARRRMAPRRTRRRRLVEMNRRSVDPRPGTDG